jgi:hypothetical protein
MRPMKRAIGLALGAIMAAVLVAPFGFSVTGGITGGRTASVQVASNVALADPCGGACSPPVDPHAANPFNADNCVVIALPIAPGTSGTCSLNGHTGIANNPAAGGAIMGYLRGWLKLFGGAVGITIILMLIVAGIQYITSAGDPTAVKSAKNRVVNAITALVLYLMMFAILSFLVPGGILT